MALITCRECGAQVSSSAPTCPQCGVPSPAGKSATITVTRRKQLSAGARRLDVQLDDGESVKLGGGAAHTFDLTPGKHTLFFCYGDADVYEEDFEIEHGQALNAEIAVGKRPAFS
jgi:hypothetical protein